MYEGTVILANSTQQGPSWVANIWSAIQETSHTLWKPKVYYHVWKSPSLVSVLTQINSVHALASYSCIIHFNIILPSMPKPSKLSLPSSFSTETVCISVLSYTCHIAHSSHSPWFIQHYIGREVKIMMLCIIQFFPFSCYFLPFRSKDLPQHPVLRCPQPLLFLPCETLSDKPIEDNRQNYTSVFLLLHRACCRVTQLLHQPLHIYKIYKIYKIYTLKH